VIKQDTLENLAKIVYLGIGSNLGNKCENMDVAKCKLLLHGIEILKCSSKHETLSWPNPKNPKFINIVIKIKTFLPPLKLLHVCNQIETELGRKRFKKNEPRTCDIDIIDYDQKILNYKNKLNLILPHPKISLRNFVLMPLFEITKKWIHPETKKNIVSLIDLLDINDIRTIKKI